MQHGLTYGINSSLSGMEDKRDGTWGIGGTFAPALLQRGIDETLNQFDLWVKDGISQGFIIDNFVMLVINNI